MKRALVWILGAPFALAAALVLALNVAAAREPTLAAPPVALAGDPWEAGYEAYRAGDLARAATCWRAVPPGHRDHARAQRFLGWKIHVLAEGRPLRGLPYVQRSVLEDPFDGNGWEDLGRTYAAALGWRPAGGRW